MSLRRINSNTAAAFDWHAYERFCSIHSILFVQFKDAISNA